MHARRFISREWHSQRQRPLAGQKRSCASKNRTVHACVLLAGTRSRRSAPSAARCRSLVTLAVMMGRMSDGSTPNKFHQLCPSTFNPGDHKRVRRATPRDARTTLARTPDLLRRLLRLVARGPGSDSRSASSRSPQSPMTGRGSRTECALNGRCSVLRICTWNTRRRLILSPLTATRRARGRSTRDFRN